MGAGGGSGLRKETTVIRSAAQLRAVGESSAVQPTNQLRRVNFSPPGSLAGQLKIAEAEPRKPEFDLDHPGGGAPGTEPSECDQLQTRHTAFH